MKRLLFIALFLGMAPYALGDTITYLGSDAGSVESSSVLTFSATATAGTNTILIVSVGNRNFNDPSQPNTVTFDGAAMTKAVGVDDGNTYTTSSIWYKVAPASGAHSVVITFPAGAGHLWITGCSVSLSGVDQSTPIDDTGSNTAASAATISLANLTSTVANAGIVDSVASAVATTMSAETNRTQRQNQTGFGSAGSGSCSTLINKTAAGTPTLQWSLAGGSSNASEVGIALKPAASSTRRRSMPSANQ